MKKAFCIITYFLTIPQVLWLKNGENQINLQSLQPSFSYLKGQLTSKFHFQMNYHFKSSEDFTVGLQIRGSIVLQTGFPVSLCFPISPHFNCQRIPNTSSNKLFQHTAFYLLKAGANCQNVQAKHSSVMPNVNKFF